MLFIMPTFSPCGSSEEMGEEFHERPTSISRITELQGLAGLQDDPERGNILRRIAAASSGKKLLYLIVSDMYRRKVLSFYDASDTVSDTDVLDTSNTHLISIK